MLGGRIPIALHAGGQDESAGAVQFGLDRVGARRMHLPDRNDPNRTHDLGQVGEIDAIDPSLVRTLQDGAFIPVISPIGFGADGLSYNINADLVAGKMAESRILMDGLSMMRQLGVIPE